MRKTRTQKKEKGGIQRRSLWFILLNFAVIAVIALLEFGGGERPQRIAVRALNFRFLAAAVGCFLIMLAAETWKYAHLLLSSGHPRPVHTGFRCAVLGKYFDNITPAGFGGQPFQIHYLKKHGCSDGVSGALPILGFLGLQFTFIAIALAVFIFGSRVFQDLLTVRLAAWLGLVFYAFVPTCVVLFSIAPKALQRIVRGGTRLLQRIHIIKDAERTSGRAIAALESYTDSVRYFRSRPVLIAVVFVTSLVFRVAMLALPWFVLRSFGAEVSFPRCFCQVTYIYAVITLIPTPGNSGAAEASFYTVFSMLSTGSVFWAMLVWRLLCYYSWLLCGAGHYVSRAATERKPYRPLPAGEAARPAFFVDVFFPHVDGVVETVHAYAGRMAGSAVVCPGGQGKAYVDPPDYPVLRVPTLRVPGLPYAVPLPWFAGRVRRTLQKGRYTVFHAHSPFTIGHFALRMGRRMGVPVVATFHSKYYDDVLHIYRSAWFARMITRYIVRFYRQADEVWACSASTAETLRGYGYEGEIRVMENGTDAVMPSDPEEARAAAVRRFALPEDRPLLLFVGQLIWQKNLKLVLETCAELKRRGFPFCMVIAGEGYDEKAVRKYAADLGLTDGTVRFPGLVEDRALLEGLYLASGVLFFPSLYDNAPLVVREAAAMGLPSLLLRDSNAAECVTDGENGFTEADDRGKMADKIIGIFNNDLTKSAGERARETIPIPWDEITRRVGAAYAEAIDHTAKSPQPRD